MFRKILSFLGTRVGIALLFAILVIGAAALVKTKSGNAVPEKGPAALAVERIVKKSLQDDTDGDGLKNWEEALYKTDPESPDSDSDGMNDGIEVSSNRDPLVSGTGQDATSKSATSTGTTLTDTDRFSQELFARYLQAKQAGQEIDQEFSDRIAEEILSKDYSAPEKVFVASELSLIKEPALAQIREYGNTFGKIISTPLPDGARNELLILDSIQTNGMTDADKIELEKLQDRYSLIHTNLASMRVPSEIATIHALFIRSIDTLRSTVSGIQNLDTDPIGSLKKITLYEEGLNNLSLTSSGLKKYFLAKGVLFGKTEPGYTFTQ